ncbi:MAG TPA: FeoA family protein [Syntrophomonadaceae bacterium]|nr:FeoA family protein [Syntrophomonadaceae bacterium]
MGISISLTDLPIKQEGIVEEILGTNQNKRRLLDLGFVPGTRVKTVRKSPAGNPIAYLIRGTVIALRKSETDLIIVQTAEENEEESYAWGTSNFEEKI